MYKQALVGRVIYALPFMVFGAFHLSKAAMMAGMVPAWVPGGILWIYITGAAMIAAAISIIINVLAYWACLGLALLMLTFVVTVHIPNLSNPQMAMMAMPGLLKDTSLAGAALFIGSMLCKCSEDCKTECKPEDKKS